MIKKDDLLARCRAGDPSAYKVLYDQYAAAVYSSILRLTGHTRGSRRYPSGQFCGSFQGDFRLPGEWFFQGVVKTDRDQQIGRPSQKEKSMRSLKMDALDEANIALPNSYRAIFNPYAIEGIPHT